MAGELSTSVILNNATIRPLTVHPTLYSLDGRAVKVSPVVLQPLAHAVANLSDWLAQAGVDAAFTQGSLSLTYEAAEATFLGSQVTLTDPSASLSFDVPSDNAGNHALSDLQGLWWRPDGDTDYDLIVSNASDKPADVLVNFTGDHGSEEALSISRTLTAHQTQIFSLKELPVPFSTGEGGGKMGGISITHSGTPGAVIAYGMAAQRSTGFSSGFTFSDPSARKSQVLAATHLLVGTPDLPGFPAQSNFTSVAVVRNASNVAVDVTPSVSFASNGTPQTVTFDILHLEPQQVQTLNVNDELNRKGFRGPLTGTGLTLASNGSPAAVEAHLTSFDQTRNHVFDVPLKDPASAVNRFGGNYPWTLEGDEQSIIHVRNSGETAARFIVQIDYDGGSYTLPLQELAPQQEKSFDIRLLRDAQVKDSIGRVIPSTVTSGQATWKAHGSPSLTGRLEVYNAAEATASSLSCSTTCCISTVDTWCDPPSMSGLAGDTVTVNLLESLQQECDGRILGPFVVTDQAVWSSSNTAVITVGPVTTAGCQVSCLSAGTANAHADFDGISSILDITSGVCEGTFIPFPADCPFELRNPVLVGKVFLPSVANDGNATISGQPFTLEVQAVDPNNANILANFNGTVAVNFSEISGPGESSFPANVQLSAGKGLSAALTLTVVTGTRPGRFFILESTTGNVPTTPGIGLVNVWFQVTMDVEFWKNCGFVSCPNLGSYFCQRAYGPGFAQPTSFVALTHSDSANLANRALMVRNPGNGLSQSTTVQDAGPTLNNPYWNTGSFPGIGGCLSDVLMTALGQPNGCKADGTPFGRLQVQWRFQ